MKILRPLSICMAGALGLLINSSCTSQGDVIEEITESEAVQMHTCKLKLDVTRTSFDSTRAEDDAEWEDGAQILLTFTVGDSTTYGDAVYNNGEWSVNYYGTLASGISAKCQAVYFENVENISGPVASMTNATAIYEDTNGIYVFQDGELSVTANLTPKTGRIRFAGAANEEVKVYGINYYSGYDSSTGIFSSTTAMLTLKVDSNGYTPYVYGVFADAEEPKVNMVTSESAYTRYFPTTVLKQGESGFVTIPTENSHSGWTARFILKVNGVVFDMIPVLYNSVVYLLSETETTEEQYVAVMGGVATTSQKAKTGVTSGNWDTFMSTLKLLTSLNFGLPLPSVWGYAYKGGALSKGYTYSGSNNIDDVAWYSGNSDGTVHDVKQLQPNELGFYDMAGNVAEYCYNNYYEYGYGGNFNSAKNYCLSTDAINFASSSCGYRPYFKP